MRITKLNKNVITEMDDRDRFMGKYTRSKETASCSTGHSGEINRIVPLGMPYERHFLVVICKRGIFKVTSIERM